MMKINEALQWRYSTKEFDPTKKISDEDFSKIKNILRLSPSSVNVQPWHFIIADDEAGKARIAKSTTGRYDFNKIKVTDASHVVVYCACIRVEDDYLTKLLEKEDADGRFKQPEHRKEMDEGRRNFILQRRFDVKDEAHWIDKQVYLNMGTALMGAAVMGIDAVPMEGAEMSLLDEEFNLRQQGYSALAVLSFGYRKAEDFNAQLPKSRLSEDIIFSKA